MTTMRKKPRVLFVHHFGGAGGGAEMSLHELVTFLGRDGQVEPLAALPPGPLAARLETEGIRCFTLPMAPMTKSPNPLKWWHMLHSVRGAAPELRRLVKEESIDLVHANTDQACLYAALALPRGQPPLIWHCRDLASLFLPGHRLARRVDRMIAVSTAVLDHLNRYAKDKKRIETIPNGINVESFTAPSNTALFQLPDVPPDAFVVGMVAQYVPWKRHEAFVQAAQLSAAAISNMHFLIVGACRVEKSAAYRAQLEAYARKLGVANRMTFVGEVADIRGVMNRIDCLVHPADREPFGRVMVEAMASQKPVVAVDGGGPRDIVTHMHDGILVPSPSPPALAGAIAKIHSSPDLAATLAKNARETALKKYDISSVAFKVKALYRETLSLNANDRS